MSKVTGAIALLGVLTALSACSPDPELFSSKTFRIPYPDENGAYALREVELKTYREPEKFRGDVAQVYVEPREADGKLDGEQPIGRYIKDGAGVIVPSDFVSMQATTVYAHMERLQELDEKLGVAGDVRWPLKIGVQTNVIDRGRGVNNNAVYDGRLDALLIVPYKGSGLPIAMNAGVLAHEHFHMIFQSFVLAKVKEKSVVVGKPSPANDILFGDHDGWAETPRPSRRGVVLKATVGDEEIEKAAEEMPKRVYNGFLLRALNEGIADFWGWVYTGDSNFIELSLPSEGGVRRLDVDSGRLWNGKTLRRSIVDLRRSDKLIPADVRVTLAYIVGTQYARFLRDTAIELSGQEKPDLAARLQVGRMILETLPSIAITAAQEYDLSFLSPNFILKPLTLRLGKISEKSCERLGRFKADDKAFDLPATCPKKPDSRADDETPVLTHEEKPK